MITKNEFPILEYDNASLEVISPRSEFEGVELPEKCIFAFLGDCVDQYAKDKNAILAETFINISRHTPIYVVEDEGEKFCLVQPSVGAAAACQLLDTLIACGCKKIIATGSCGVLTDMDENAFIIPTKALRDEGTSYHYMPATRFAEIDIEMVDAIATTFDELGIPYEKCVAWTTDGFFRETQDMVKYRVEEGCTVVDMECSALTCCAQKRGAKFGQFFFTADSLANVEEYDTRGFGFDSHLNALKLALNVIKKL